MIIKGNRHNNGPKLARYMITGEHGERAELAELRGFASENIVDAFRDVHLMAEANGIENPFFHVQVRLPEGEELKPEQWQRTADAAQKRVGLTGQARAITFHINEATGERHMHMAISLIDEETLHAKPVPYYQLRLKALARELEKEFDITRVKNTRDGPIKYAAKKNEQQQAQRLGVDKDELRNTIRACWDQSDCGRSFQAALQHEAMILAQGDQRGLVVVDYAGGVHALGKRILDINKKAIHERLADLDLNELPNVQQAQSLMRQLKAELQPQPRPQEKKEPNWNRDRANQTWEDSVINAAIEQEKTARQFVDPKPEKPEIRAGGREKEAYQPEQTASGPGDQFRDAAQDAAKTVRPQRPLQPIEQKLWGAYRSGPGKTDFAAALDNHGIAFARVDADEADKSYREGQFAKAVGRSAPVYQEGEIVVVREAGLEYHRNGEWKEGPRVYKMDQAHAEKYLQILSLDKSRLKGIDATKAALDEKQEQRREERDALRLERATVLNTLAPEIAVNLGGAVRKGIHMAGKGAALPLGAANKALDIVSSIFESIIAPQLTPQIHQGEIATAKRSAEAEAQIDFSKWTADRAQERQNRESDQAARDRQREIERER